jgi:hypothetical protein
MMPRATRIVLLLLIFGYQLIWPQKLLIPMDTAQRDHLKAYGITFWTLNKNVDVEWLLNYRGGSFLMDALSGIERECQVRGVTAEPVDATRLADIYSTIDDSNMDIVLLEKAPRIAVYSPPNKQPWDDAVTLVLTYAEVPYAMIYDEEVLSGGLSRYDWLHLHVSRSRNIRQWH